MIGQLALRYLLNTIYTILFVIATPWLIVQAWRTGKYREGWPEKLFGRIPSRNSTRPCVWFHAVSVGELQLLRPLIQEFQQRWPAWDIAISSTTVTGRKLARESYPNLYTFYAPLDFSWAVTNVFRRLRPNLLVLAELELWPNLLLLAQKNAVDVAIVNGRLSEHSFKGYRKIRPLTQLILPTIKLIAAQNQAYADRFTQLGAIADKVHITGSIKFDGANPDRNHPEVRQRRQWAHLDDRQKVWFVGSTQEPEEQMAMDIFLRQKKEFPSLKMIVVPRHAERFQAVADLLQASGLKIARRSELDSAGPSSWDVLLIDTIGELRWWWGVADLATVGGSFGTRGGQNMIEPCAYGACVSFGPNTRNFKDIVTELLQYDAATQLPDSQALESWLVTNLRSPEAARRQGDLAAAWVSKHLGATNRTADLLAELIDFHQFTAPNPLVSRDAA